MAQLLSDEERKSLYESLLNGAQLPSMASREPAVDDEAEIRAQIDAKNTADIAALEDSEGQSRDSRLVADLGRGFDRISSAVSGIAPSESFYKDAISRSNLPFEVSDRRQKIKDQNARLLEDYLNKKYRRDAQARDDQYRRERDAESMDIRRQQLELMGGLRAQGQQERHDRDVEKDVQKLGDKVGNAQDIVYALNTIENQLGFKLDDADTSSGALRVGGKDIDLPGVSLPGFGRLSVHSNAARDLNRAMSKVFNVELKERSGAAVTTPEMERLKTEFAQGKFNTESEMIGALKDYRSAVAAALKNREAMFRPEVVDTYKDRGGATYRDVVGPSKGPRPGTEMDGYIFQGGDPKDPKSWVKK